MLKKRIIPCLDVKEGRTVKGVNFEGLQDAGDAIELAHGYSHQGADEIVFLDITATHEKRKTMVNFAKAVAKKLNVPFTIGGGISSLEDAKAVILAGADKVGINSAAVKNPEIITQISKVLGAQAVVIAIDAKQRSKGKWEVMINGARKETGLDVIEWAQQVEKLGAGEILLTSIDKDGTKSGFDISLTKKVSESVSIPVIASGGVGNKEHFIEVFQKTSATAALAASIFHFGEVGLLELNQYLKEQGIEVRDL